MKLTLRDVSLPVDFHGRLDDLVGVVAECSSMPAARRAERIHIIAPELLAITALCDGVAPAEMVKSLVEVDGYARQLANALNHIAHHNHIEENHA